jgi:hypothetical protein
MARPSDRSVVVYRASDPAWRRPLADIGETFQFEPHAGWKGHIERVDSP